MTTQAVYPKGVFSWTDRTNLVSNVLASDVNSLAADLIAVENAIGTTPNVESSPLAGNPVTYATVNARISDVQQGNQHPFASLVSQNFTVPNRGGDGGLDGFFVNYRAVYDPFGYYNGQDITIQSTGLYLVDHHQIWDWNEAGRGWLQSSLYVTGSQTKSGNWNWEQFDTSGPSSYPPQKYADTGFSWIGPLSAGQRVQVVSLNGTYVSPYSVIISYLKVYQLRALPPGVQEIQP